jgi:DNA-binding PadR family transcriptional regulator
MGVREGVLYPALHRLERKRLVEARWGKTDTGRRAKFYTLTDAGREHLETEAERLTEHSEAVLSLLRTSGR